MIKNEHFIKSNVANGHSCLLKNTAQSQKIIAINIHQSTFIDSLVALWKMVCSKISPKKFTDDVLIFHLSVTVAPMLPRN
jgi:hypothetical protein